MSYKRADDGFYIFIWPAGGGGDYYIFTSKSDPLDLGTFWSHNATLLGTYSPNGWVGNPVVS